MAKKPRSGKRKILGFAKRTETAYYAPKGKPGRPVTRHMPDPIPDTMENIARAIMQGPPKKKWRFLDGDDE